MGSRQPLQHLGDRSRTLPHPMAVSAEGPSHEVPPSLSPPCIPCAPLGWGCAFSPPLYLLPERPVVPLPPLPRWPPPPAGLVGGSTASHHPLPCQPPSTAAAARGQRTEGSNGGGFQRPFLPSSPPQGCPTHGPSGGDPNPTQSPAGRRDPGPSLGCLSSHSLCSCNLLCFPTAALFHEEKQNREPGSRLISANLRCSQEWSPFHVAPSPRSAAPGGVTMRGDRRWLM